MGDGALVYFGYPQAHEDDAERAVRALRRVGHKECLLNLLQGTLDRNRIIEVGNDKVLRCFITAQANCRERNRR
jgi:hypothetical protein